MGTTSLYESVMGAHSLPRLFPKPPKQPLLTGCLFSLKSRSKFFTSKLSLRNPTLISSRYFSQWSANTFEEWFGRFLLAYESSNGRALRHPDYKSCRKTTGSTHVMDHNGSLDKAFSENLKREFLKARDVLFADNSVGHFLKALLLFGFLTLQGSQPALAGPDIASGLQSIPYLSDLGDISTGFASAFLLIFFSELGDKTFFIAALLAARNSAGVVFAGTFGALAAMTIISVALGRTFHYVDEILPFRFGETDLPIDDIAAVLLLVYFGVSTLLDATSSDSVKADEEQKEAELAVSEFSGNGAGILAAANTVISTFILVFVAEWGDKSFFSTIALAAASSPLGVIGGALAGHGVATLAISYIGGVLFLVFAAVTLVEIVN
ncbi:GDT1-like protein 1, chloroplastic isoform X2 [Ziziphus jujuba]|uniref:GDT1 family protein n=1 Tax=Ziziphus jujuba TaxID=326968 RepID=A0A6P4AMN0_ZIZJJ|nr:GDT1-like protein 1, chloroplastic isoform X2 [Ziziphus jujuba]